MAAATAKRKCQISKEAQASRAGALSTWQNTVSPSVCLRLILAGAWRGLREMEAGSRERCSVIEMAGGVCMLAIQQPSGAVFKDARAKRDNATKDEAL